MDTYMVCEGGKWIIVDYHNRIRKQNHGNGAVKPV